MTRDHDRAADMRRRLAALEGDGLDGVAPTPEEFDLARSSAHALGQLEGAEAEAMERHLAGAASAAERAVIAESIEIAAALRADVAPAPGPVGVASVRTAVAAALAAPRPSRSAPAPDARGGARAAQRRLALALLGSLASAALVLVVLPVPRQSPDTAPGVPANEPAVPAAAPLAAAAPTAARETVARDEAPAGETVARDEAPVGETVAAATSPPETSGLAVAEPAPSGPPPTPVPSDALAIGGDARPAIAAAPVAESAASAVTEDAPAAASGALGGVARESEAAGLAANDEALAQGSVAGKRLAMAPDGAGRRAAPAGGASGVPMAPGSMGRIGNSFGAGAGAQAPSARAPGSNVPGSNVLGARAPLAKSGPPPAGAAGGRLREEHGDEVMERRAEGRWFHDRDRLALERGRAGTGERYAQFVENPFRAVDESPLSTFAIDVDTASYAVVRRFINDRQRPPADAVRLEEMLNYFRYDDPPPADGDPLALRLESAACPWQPRHRLLRVALKGREIAAAARPGTSLVFLVDVSGSMNEPDKLPLVKQALGMLVDELSENDRVAIVTYAGEAGVKLAPTSGEQKARIRAAIESLTAGGSTNGSAGIEVAYRLAQEAFVKGGSNRVLLATDGDLNVGITDDAALVGLIKEKAGSGVFLTVLGFGRGNLQDEKMEKLADNGNGLYAYLDSAREARKVLVEQLSGSTVTIAKDVKIQIEFNPARVESYRLLGYENRILAARDFSDDTKDAGDVGAGHGVTALYEIVPVAGTTPQAAPDRPLKYKRSQRREAEPSAESPELCTVSLRWKAPEAGESLLREIPFEDAGGSFEDASADLRFAAAVAEFGMLLRSSRHRGEAQLEHVAATASAALGADRGGLRAEFLDLVREARALLPHEGRPTPN